MRYWIILVSILVSMICIGRVFTQDLEGSGSCDPECVNGDCSEDTCVCAIGFVGAACDTPVPTPCENHSCLHGTCVPVDNNNHQCDCTAGWVGSNCDQELVTCSSNPCQNGGTCEDLHNMYNCKCTLKYAGTNCQKELGVPTIQGVTVKLVLTTGTVNYECEWIDNVLSQSYAAHFSIEWFADSTSILIQSQNTQQTVTNPKINVEILAGNFGKKLKCAVKGTYLQGDNFVGFGPTMESSQIQTGITVSHSPFILLYPTPSQGAQDITLTFHTPFLCSERHRSYGNCFLNVWFKITAYDERNLLFVSSCSNSNSLKPDIMIDSCNLTIPDMAGLSTPRHYAKTLRAVINNQDGTGFRSFRVKIFTKTSVSSVWSNYQYSTNAYVYQPSPYPYSTRPCSVNDDPYIVPFSRRYSYGFHPRWLAGWNDEYVLFKSSATTAPTGNSYANFIPESIVTIFVARCCYIRGRSSYCSTYAACTCGIAVRVANDVYILDKCRYTLTGNRPAVLYYGETMDPIFPWIRRRPPGFDINQYGSYFKIGLPSGTVVKVKVDHHNNNMDIWVYPSRLDQGRASGLCGQLGGSSSQAAVTSSGDVSSFSSERFKESWKTRPGTVEHIFQYGPYILRSNTVPTPDMCSCRDETFSPQGVSCQDLSQNVFCWSSLYRSIGRSLWSMAWRTPQVLLGRKKRDLSKSDVVMIDDFDDMPHNRVRRQTDTGLGINIAWNEDLALEYCQTEVGNSTAAQTCYEYVGDYVDSQVLSCQSDILIMNATVFTQGTIDTIKTKCSDIIARNVSLQEAVEGENGTITYLPPDGVLDALCPKDCSGNGVCNANGTCDCIEMMAGDDCSQNTTDPPSLTSIFGEHICDHISHGCDIFMVLGENFVQGSNASCLFDSFALPGTRTVTDALDHNDHMHGESSVLSSEEIICHIPEVLDHHNLTFALAFHVSVTNDEVMQNASNGVLYILYSSRCQDCTDSGCVTRPDKCIINDTCYLDQEVLPSRPCQFCDVSLDKEAWTLNATWCLIDGACYRDGEESIMMPGQVCDYAVSPTGWTDFPECDSNPCQNNGTCVEGEDGYNCTCADGWFSDNCQDDADECASSPCANNGVCKDNYLGYECECPMGFEGLECETDVDECKVSPCDNGGTCYQATGNSIYTCKCAPGFYGTNCTLERDECASNPCYGNSTCRDDINGFTCICAPGWTGISCHFAINECDSNPCLNGATCHDKQASYMCSCADGYTGDTCDIAPTTTTVLIPPSTVSGPVGFTVKLVYRLLRVVFREAFKNKNSTEFKTFANDFCIRVALVAQKTKWIQFYVRCSVPDIRKGSTVVDVDLDFTAVEDREGVAEDLRLANENEIQEPNGFFDGMGMQIPDVTLLDGTPTGPSTQIVIIIACTVIAALIVIVVVTILVYRGFSVKRRQTVARSTEGSNESYQSSWSSNLPIRFGSRANLPTRYAPQDFYRKETRGDFGYGQNSGGQSRNYFDKSPYW